MRRLWHDVPAGETPPAILHIDWPRSISFRVEGRRGLKMELAEGERGMVRIVDVDVDMQSQK
jgi:hypothetical protein